MAVKVITETKQKEVNLLEDAQIDYVSLVRHGANRMPFRVVKQEKLKGGDKEDMTLAIQSIILPNGTSLSDMASIDGMGYLSEARTDAKKEFDEYHRLDQLSTEKFDAKSFRVLRVGKGFLLVGQLGEKAEVEGALTIGKEQAEKIADIPTSPMESIVGDPSVAAQQAMAIQFRDMFERELYAMLDVVNGSLKQAGTDAKKRKSTVLSAVDGFKSFLTFALDAIGEQSTKAEVKIPTKQEKTEEDNMDYKDEEFVNAVTTIVTGAIEAHEKAKAEAKAAAEKETPVPEKTPEAKTVEEKKDKSEDKPDTLNDIAATLKAVTDTVNGLAEKVDKFENQLSTEPAGETAPTAEDKEKSDKEDKEKKETVQPVLNHDHTWKDPKINSKIFRGLLVNS